MGTESAITIGIRQLTDAPGQKVKPIRKSTPTKSSLFVLMLFHHHKDLRHWQR